MTYLLYIKCQQIMPKGGMKHERNKETTAESYSKNVKT